jgi:hypothetical protein
MIGRSVPGGAPRTSTKKPANRKVSASFTRESSATSLEEWEPGAAGIGLIARS